jgi:FtsH-binding integral membrane protein
MGTAAPRTAGFPQLALGYAHRRARVFWFWWMGMIFALPGAVQASVLAATGQSPENGLVLAGLGVVISGAGWLMAIGPRFTRTDPRPADDVNRAEQYIRIAPGTAAGMIVAMLAIVVVLMVATPRGTSPEVLPILAFLAAFPLPIAAGMLYSRHLHRHRESFYAGWLERR